MQAYPVYIENGKIIPVGDSIIPDSKKAMIIVSDEVEKPRKQRSRISLKERIGDFDGDYIGEEWDTGRPVGDEIF
jgi:hypothetical protein